MTHIRRAKHIARALGYYKAARFLALRGYSVEAAIWILFNK